MPKRCLKAQLTKLSLCRFIFARSWVTRVSGFSRFGYVHVQPAQVHWGIIVLNNCFFLKHFALFRPLCALNLSVSLSLFTITCINNYHRFLIWTSHRLCKRTLARWSCIHAAQRLFAWALVLKLYLLLLSSLRYTGSFIRVFAVGFCHFNLGDLATAKWFL